MHVYSQNDNNFRGTLIAICCCLFCFKAAILILNFSTGRDFFVLNLVRMYVKDAFPVICTRRIKCTVLSVNF